jgi:hypothetical protein
VIDAGEHRTDDIETDDIEATTSGRRGWRGIPAPHT